MARARRIWRTRQARFDPHRLVFIDETGTSTKMVRAYGRCARGQRLIGRVPYGHWKTTTFTCGLRCTGLVAPYVLDGPMNGEAFRVYVERILVPTLRPGDLVIMDRLGSHRSTAVQRAITGAGARRVLLPPYSPDLNPIELALAKLKTLLRRAAERSVAALWDRIGLLLDAFTAAECANYFRHAGYASP